MTTASTPTAAARPTGESRSWRSRSSKSWLPADAPMVPDQIGWGRWGLLVARLRCLGGAVDTEMSERRLGPERGRQRGAA